MNLTDAQKNKVTLRHYEGGHMFYTWASSRKALFKDMRAFYSCYVRSA